MEGEVSEIPSLAGAFRSLLSLQDLDRQISGWEHQRLELAAKSEAGRKLVQDAKAKQDELKKAFENQQKSRGLLELEVKAKQETIKKYNGQLGELKSNEAYTAMLSEIKKAQDEIAGMEERILGLMENEETARRQYEADARALAEKAKEVEAGQSGIQSEIKAFEDRAAAEQSRRQSFLDGLPKIFADTYQRLFKPKKGMPVARVQHGICEGCSMKVPPHLVNEIRKIKGLVFCQHCARILVVPEGLEQGAPPAA
jgi:predicted  nucleic acid-binding Zn-ribbon protein